MRNIKLVVEYDGTNFFGWQKQVQQRTVQEEIEKILEQVLQHTISLLGAGRTDAGVHAKGQVANFLTETPLANEKIFSALNGLLPEDIAILSVENVPPEFHSRYSAREREYVYTIATQPSALHRKFCWEFFFSLDIERMNAAAVQISGEHNFSSFCKNISEQENTACTVYSAEWKRELPFLKFTIRGNRFLHGMVRTLVGTLVDVGRDAVTLEEFSTILHSHNRSNASQSAPAKGLCLEKVIY
ncbi:MAG: tRNA pseudouridine(38-40) synthase TruA [Ignavibacteriales bacterium]|nr:tRNA pseudouridine(38-40) synthase TruA [Ignavibacteriales bacterium]